MNAPAPPPTTADVLPAVDETVTVVTCVAKDHTHPGRQGVVEYVAAGLVAVSFGLPGDLCVASAVRRVEG